VRVLVLVLATCLAACGGDEKPAAAPSATADWFVDVARDAGLDFVHVNGMSGQRYIAEIMAPGVALFDYDNDGDLDVYAIQGQPLRKGDSGFQRAESQDRLYRNDLIVRPDGSRALRFTDVTAGAGLTPLSYGMGAAAGDIDNDGWTDLYLTRLGPDALLKNNGDGTFTNVFAPAGLADPGWTVAASFFDYDRDGWLDLFVSGYLRYSIDADTKCVGPSGAHDYCSPQNYPALPGRLFRNRGDGTFADVTVSSRIGSAYGPALGSLALDVNDDAWLDLYVANDGAENQLWVNQRNGTFVDEALLAGVAVNGDGKREGSMGLDAADYDNDGDDDLLIANLSGEGSTLYVNDAAGMFHDAGASSGIRSRSLPYTGFGTSWVDIDNDGWLDILTANGAIQTIQTLAGAGDPFPLHQRKQVLRNDRNGRFEDVTARAGAVFVVSEVGRGAAFGDVDNDGDTDVLVANNNGPLRLLVNRQGDRHRWLGVRAVGTGGRDMPGARVGLTLATGETRWRRVRADGSYASANDPRVLFGLGDAGSVVRVRVQWPGGRTEEWPIEDVNRWVTVAEGRGPLP
jgi:hypothetical protein